MTSVPDRQTIACTVDEASSHLLRCDSLTKRYAVNVLEDVSLELSHGEIHAIVGANGAGKSTFCKIVSGLVRPTSGTMWIRGTEYRPANKRHAETAGVQIVQQELNLIGNLTVAENLLFGRFPHRWGRIHRGELHRRARLALDRFGLDEISLDTPARRLGVGQQQMVEIATALDRDCRVLILDEPTAALTHRETDRLFIWLRKLRDQGVGMIYISHRLEEVIELADRVTVLRDGKKVLSREASCLSADEMVRGMTGDDTLFAHHDFVSHCQSNVRFRVQGIGQRSVLHPTSFDVHAGERLGVAGLIGSGRTELLRAIFGADVADSGHVVLDGDPRPRRFRTPSQAVAAGLAMVTEDRKQSGLLLSQSVMVNATLATMSEFRSAVGIIDHADEWAASTRYRDQLAIRCRDVGQSCDTLSGGNQQKVVIAKWLLRDAKVFLFDEPTRGVDIAATRPIYALFDELAQAGKSLVIVSSDLDELLRNCDRILVLSAGRVTGEFHRDTWSRESIMQAFFAGYTE